MIDIYGTLGPSCSDEKILEDMFSCGMTGMRINTSHVSVREAAGSIKMIQEAGKRCGVNTKILIDMQGPELRIGRLPEAVCLNEGTIVQFKSISSDDEGIPVPDMVLNVLKSDIEVLLDDGKILLRMLDSYNAKVLRGGILLGGKSIALPGTEIRPPAMTEQDIENISDAVKYGITGVMQPFVRDVNDLKAVREALNKVGGEKISLLAKIENMDGVNNLEGFFDIADEIVIARGDLGNAMPLWELPKVQKYISQKCCEAGIPFMVVTQMLASMEHSAVPTRAEVSDIYNAIIDGASSVMVTGETAVGEYPVEVIRYLANTVCTYDK